MRQLEVRLDRFGELTRAAPRRTVFAQRALRAADDAEPRPAGRERSTTLMTLDNQRLTIPNGKIWGDVIRNATANDRRRINETVGISYDDDIAKAEAVALEVAKALKHVLANPEPQVLVTGLGDSSVNLSIRAWVPTKEYFASCCELRRSVKLRFDAEGISIPYPQRELHVRALPASVGALES